MLMMDTHCVSNLEFRMWQIEEGVLFQAQVYIHSWIWLVLEWHSNWSRHYRLGLRGYQPGRRSGCWI